MAAATRQRPRWAIFVHAIRVGLVVALLMLIPSPAGRTGAANSSNPPGIQHVQDLVPTAASVSDEPNAAGLWQIIDGDDNPIGLVGRTLPAASDVLGYRGPSEALLVFDNDLNIKSVGLLQSADTTEHVTAVVQDELFFEQFKNWPWGGPEAGTDVDAVSGATLTSLALAEGILKRIGSDRPSLVFPDNIAAEDVSEWFDRISMIDSSQPISVAQYNGKEIGRILRTGIFSDDIAGYQGPSELLLKVGTDDKVDAILLRGSFDNDTYVDYVRVEAGFWAIFEGKTIQELSSFDPGAEGVEGVSGATMTSLAVADTLVAASKAYQAQKELPQQTGSTASAIHWPATDIATIACLIFLAIASRFRAFRKPRVRKVWLVCVITMLGLWSGNLVSMALIAGWSSAGIAWRLAPGLAAIAFTALLAPPITKGNPYCNHLCPHGAIQQLIKPKPGSRRRLKLSRRVSKYLSFIPGITLSVAYLMLLFYPVLDLSAWEPFHAYLYQVAGWSAFATAAVSLLLATFIPMGYCRLGCPTGTLLDYVRRSASSHKIGRPDAVAIGLLVVAIAVRVAQ